MLFVAGSIYGQNDRTGTRQLTRVNNSKEVRQNFEQRAADGLKVIIYQAGANGLAPVSPGKTFKTGDRFKLKFESNFDGYVYVINVTPRGENRLLFPRGLTRHNNVRAGESYDIPAANDFKFEGEPGLEVLRVLMSRSPVYILETVLDRAPRNASYIALTTAVAQSLEEIIGKPERSKTGGITTKSGARKSGTKTRTLTLDRKKQITFVVVSGSNGLPSRFQPGEISVFEIRLNHL